MPLSGIGSYPPTMQEFINHWTQVNASLGATPLLLRGAYALANFSTDRTNIVNAINAVEFNKVKGSQALWVAVGANGQISIYNDLGRAQVLVDVFAYVT